ncbi:MAG: glutamate racemase [Spirochaetota bacterium]|nr:glutamate racemase [Spirochaetota bacterium]
MTTKPIGVFDSGIGGLGIFNAIVKELPHESIVYFADSKRCPYGTKSQSQIQQITKSIINYLIKEHDIKIAVVACNTATVASIQYLRNEFPDLPFVGVVPVIKPASKITQTKKIGCLATEMTVKSEAQACLIQDHAESVDVYNVACNGLVELIEEGFLNTNIMKNKLLEYLDPLIEKGIDVLALGCTHYTLLKNQIEKLIPNNIKILDSNEPVAKQVKRVLVQKNLLLNNGIPKYRFLINGDPEHFAKIVSPFLNGTFTYAEQVTL